MIRVKPINYSHPSLQKHQPDQEADMNSTVPENYLRAVKMYSSCKFMGYRTGLACNVKQTVDQYQFITYEESMQYVAQITQQLLAKGLMKGDRVVIYAKNSPLWLLSDIAISFAGGISVPIYDTLGIENIVYCCNLTEAAFIIVSTDYLANIVSNLKKFEHLKQIIALEKYDQDALTQQVNKLLLNDGKVYDDTRSLYSMNSNNSQSIQGPSEEIIETTQNQAILTDKLSHLQFEENSNQLDYLTKIIKNNQLTSDGVNSVIFSSGTSGKPKGVILSHKNVLGCMKCACRQIVPDHIDINQNQSSVLSYLPLAHIYERSVEHGALMKGYLIYYSSGNVKNLTKDIQMSNCALMVGVPRVYVKIYNTIMDKMTQASPVARTVFKIAFNLKKIDLKLHSQRKHFTDAVFKSIQKALGNPQTMICGSAALPGKVREFFEITSGAKFHIGYTMSETGGSGLVNYANYKYNSPNQIGFSTDHCEAKIVDRSDKCEFTLEDNVGELKIKGPGVAIGYIDGKWGKIQPIVDSEGFFSTGDLVRVYPDGAASFIRRVGLVVKLQHGEFVDLEAIEAALEGSPVIMQAFAHGEPDKTAPVCFVSLDSNILRQKLDEDIINRFKANDAAAINQIEQFVCKEGDEIIRKAGLKGFNVPKAYKVLLDVDWSQNQDFYTPSQKKKHGPFIKAHQSQLKQLWELVEQRENKIVPKKSNLKLFVLFAFVFFIFALLMMK
ncbi:Long_chain fatty acid CoA ligase [Hexamita inflata]|uniref:Long chain fatty acid CoA ligase n=1 Tax=Hexamita inflata TaxID=28002 RepID=A0AA86TYN7_9EUKA|nr:Long chain fatty acid CoA ligase [Hexamita inflata]